MLLVLLPAEMCDMSLKYLLLRNNHQSGPFTFDELKQQVIKPDDLIWIEGHSLAWNYPHEIKELSEEKNKDGGPGTENNSRKNRAKISQQDDTTGIPPSYHVFDIEQKAEELRQRAMSSNPDFHYVKNEIENSFRNQPMLNENEFQFIDHTKKKYEVSEWFGGVVITLLVFGGLYYGKALLQPEKSNDPIVATQIISSDSHAAKPVKQTRLIDTALVNKDTIQELAKIKTIPRKQIVTKKASMDTNAILVKNPETEFELPAIQSKPQPETTQVIVKKPSEIKPKDIITTEIIEEDPESDKKKRTLGQAIKGLFKGKKNKVDTSGEN